MSGCIWMSGWEGEGEANKQSRAVRLEGQHSVSTTHSQTLTQSHMLPHSHTYHNTHTYHSYFHIHTHSLQNNIFVSYVRTYLLSAVHVLVIINIGCVIAVNRTSLVIIEITVLFQKRSKQ